MIKNSMRWLVVAFTFTMLFGCSTPVYEKRYAVSEGWRLGKVTKLLNAEEFLKTGRSRCREIEIHHTDRFAFIQTQVTRARGHFAKVDPDTALAVGDEVYFNAWKCDQPPIVPKAPRRPKAGQTS